MQALVTLDQTPPPGLFRRLIDSVRPPTVHASGASGQSGRLLVPADTTWSQILDYASGAGETWPFDFYGVGLPLSRNVAVSYATLNRCVTLISAGVAQLVCNGKLRVVDREGRTVKSGRARRVLEILASSPDGGVTPSFQFVEDAVADYVLDGNALLVPDLSADGTLMRLRRMSALHAEIIYARTGDAAYRLEPADGPVYEELKAARDVVHVRWPRLRRHSQGATTRESFALAPVVALRPALDIGIQGDRYIREWFSRGSKSKLHFDLGRNPGEQAHTPDQLKQFV